MLVGRHLYQKGVSFIILVKIKIWEKQNFKGYITRHFFVSIFTLYDYQKFLSMPIFLKGDDQNSYKKNSFLVKNKNIKNNRFPF